jgi:DNA-binding CsgD family transcriptional regulator
VDDKGIAERVMLQHFLQRRRGAKGPLVFVSGERMITNGAADHLVSPDDAPALWERAMHVLASDGVEGAEVVLIGGTPVALTCEPVFDGGSLLGALVRLTPVHAREAAPAAPARRATPAGMAALTDTEQSVVALAVQGLTNREVAERLFMSRHTVDSHLRSIYRKVGVNSRLALARAVTEPPDSH